MAVPFKPKHFDNKYYLENWEFIEDFSWYDEDSIDYSYLKTQISNIISWVMNWDKNTIPDTFEYGKPREWKVLPYLIKSLKKELGIEWKITNENIEIHQLVEKEIDENFDFKAVRILFKNNWQEIVKNISVTLNKQTWDIKDFHMSVPNRLVNKTKEELQTRNLSDIEVEENRNSKRGIELDSNINTPKEIAVEMIKNHWGKFLLEWKDSVIKAFEETAILKWTLDNTYSIWKDLEDYFDHFCHMNPELTLLEDTIKADWLTEWKTIKASWNYIFNVWEEWNKNPVEWNFTFILKKVWENNKWAFSVLHSSIKNNSEELKLLK